MLIIVDERGIECAAAENASTDKIPECRPYHIGVGQPVFELLRKSVPALDGATVHLVQEIRVRDTDPSCRRLASCRLDCQHRNTERLMCFFRSIDVSELCLVPLRTIR